MRNKWGTVCRVNLSVGLVVGKESSFSCCFVILANITITDVSFKLTNQVYFYTT